MCERILAQNCQKFDNFNFEFSMSHHNAHYQSYKNAPYVDKIRTATTVDQDVDQDSVGHECGWVGGGGAGHVLYSHRATAGSEAAPAQQLEPEPRPGSIRKKSGSKSLAEP